MKRLMTRLSTGLAALCASAILVACGGGGDGDQTPRVAYSKLVVFGDSLSDVGSYATPGILAVGGGKYTVNGPDAQIWVERLAGTLGLAAPCAAQTGLASSGPLAALAAPVTDVAGCYGYAQGGARVTNPIGPYNAALLGLGDTGGYLGQLTKPVQEQIQRHLLAVGGSFAADDLVAVMAGGNDVFMNLAAVAAGGDPQAAVVAMGQAGGELAAYVRQMILANGARRVVVVNLPDVSLTPFGYAQDSATQGLILLMASTFNAQLAAGLAGADGVLLVDAFTQSQDQALHPDQYDLTDVASTACDPALATLGSLGCSAATVVAGDVSRYAFADSVHPTPFGYQLLAQFVAAQMAKAGWL